MRGAWIENSNLCRTSWNMPVAPHTGSVNWKDECRYIYDWLPGRSPCGERELKIYPNNQYFVFALSLSMWGARIEKNWKVGCRHVVAPHARSENWKPICNNYSERNECRSPYGERELKIQGLMMLKEQIMSLPIRGARIEITIISLLLCLVTSLPTQGARIEIRVFACV